MLTTPMKNHHHNGPIHPVSPNSTNVIHETIAARAYEMWEEHGKPDGEADAHWLAAEREQVTGHQESEPVKPLPVSF